MFQHQNRPTRRGRAFIAAAALHAVALGALLFPWKREEPIVFVIDRPIVWHTPVAEQLGGGGGAAPIEKATPKPARTPLFVEPAPIEDLLPASTPTAIAAGPDAGPIGPGSPDGLPDSDCVGEHCTGSVPGGANPVLVDTIGIRPVPIHQPQPPYPAMARTAGLTGTVVIEILVGADGRVRDAKLVKGSAPFDSVALATVRTWRYQPVLLGGQPVVWKSTVSLKFQLK